MVLATGTAPSVRRTVSKLETAMNKIGRPDLFSKYVSLYGMPATLKKADFLSQQLEQGYAEVWSYMHLKAVGPAYMNQQASSGPWFKNRIKPILEYDRRDLVWIVFIEYPFILNFILKTLGITDFPANIFETLKNVTGPSALWVKRHRRILSIIPQKDVPDLLSTAEELNSKVKKLTHG